MRSSTAISSAPSPRGWCSPSNRWTNTTIAASSHAPQGNDNNRGKAAISDKQLTVEFQPLFSAVTRRAVGAEALVRWDRGDDDVIEPADTRRPWRWRCASSCPSASWRPAKKHGDIPL
ncbi:MAG: EAL domain-containing protein [Candidatus Competibacteraceae bacterium]|nr:EAL domain-containing protein [Candidatus Competibacteraceae bacterium]